MPYDGMPQILVKIIHDLSAAFTGIDSSEPAYDTLNSTLSKLCKHLEEMCGIESQGETK